VAIVATTGIIASLVAQADLSGPQLALICVAMGAGATSSADPASSGGDVVMANVGWIGLGAMGSPMAVCLARAGHEVSAYDIDPARAKAVVAEGVRACDSIAGAAAGADVLAIMVATPAQGESVLFGDGRAAEALKPGTVVLIMATVGAEAVTSWAQRLAAQGVELVDAPVSGGVARAAGGELLMMVGGSTRAVAKVQPLLGAMASNAPVVGPAAGDGQKVKLVNQLLCGVHLAVAAEALAFAEALGLDPATCWEVLRHGAAASFMFDDRGRRMVHGTEEVRSALDIFVKDMGLVVDAARHSAYPAPLASAAEQLYLAGRRAGLGRNDDSSVIEVLRVHRSNY
jgi:3-hydroxyisobutyrate dehydrogenase/putative dehydrogenase